MIPLQPALKAYDWGSASQNCFTKKFANTKKKPPVLAECWFGSHPSGCASMIIGERQNKAVPIPKLDALTKVISVTKPLSIQLHPNKMNAEMLNFQDPSTYDANEKPEMIIALTPFKALCGCLSLHAIKENLSTFSHTLRLHNITKRRLIRRLLTLSAQEVEALYEDVQTCRYKSDVISTIIHLHKFYPDDPAIFAPLWMNIVTLKPLEALVVPPQTLHAYISGEGVEVMACSDNVIRAGLTNKFKDLKTLFHLGHFFQQNPEVIPKSAVYSHPCLEHVASVQVLKNSGHTDVTPHKTLVLIVKGMGIVNGTWCKVGDAFLVSEDHVHVFGILTALCVKCLV